MPSSASDYEVEDRFGALDDTAVGDGRPASAHVLRQIARNSNRLAGKGGMLCNMIWRANDQAGGEATDGAFAGYAPPFGWKSFYPCPFITPHKPNLRRGEGRIRAQISNGQVLLLQICTTARPFDPGATQSRDNVVRLLGTGSVETYEFSGIPLGAGDMETIDVFLQGDRGTTLMDAANGSNSGVVDIAMPGFWEDTGAAWVLANINQSRYYVSFFDQSANEIFYADFYPRYTGNAVSTDSAQFHPNITPEASSLIVGQDYEIRERISYRFNCFVMYETNEY